MGLVTSLKVENKNTPIIVYKHKPTDLQQNIEEIIKKFNGIELGSVKTKYYEEYFYITSEDNWEVYVNINLRLSKHKIHYGEKEYFNVTAFVMLMNFKNTQVCSEIYKELSDIGELAYTKKYRNQNLNI